MPRPVAAPASGEPTGATRRYPERTIATLLSIPVALSVALPLYLLAIGRTSQGEAWALALFVIGPALTLAGYKERIPFLLWTGVAIYVAYILVWGLSWGGLHMWLGGGPMLAALVMHHLNLQRTPTPN